MRRGFRKIRQVMAGLTAAALLMTSLPQNNAYVYAVEQAEEMTHEQTESEPEEAEEKSDQEETIEAEENSGQEETKEETDAPDEDSGETDAEGEAENPEESVETEESIEFENEDAEQETEYAAHTNSLEQIVKAELAGAYQFGDAPSERGGVSAFSVEPESVRLNVSVH